MTQSATPSNAANTRYQRPRAAGTMAGSCFMRAVTPAELLTVAATLFAALAALTPLASHHAAEPARLHEMHNLRVLSQTAFKNAADDPDGVLGPVHPPASLFIYEGYSEYGGGPRTMQFVGWGEEFDPRTRPFNQMLYGFSVELATPSFESTPGDRSVFKEFQCLGQNLGWPIWPGLGTHESETERPYYEANGTSFRQNNLQVFGKILGLYGRPKDRIPLPAETLHYTEARVYQTLFTNDAWGQLEHGELEGYHRKLGWFMVNYADGQADFADFGDGSYFQPILQFNLEDARGT